MDASRRAFIHGQWNASYPEAASERPPETEIMSLIVQARPEHLPDLIRAISALEGVEVHGHDPAGKIVVVVEAETQRLAGDRMIEIDRLPNVVLVAMVFQATHSDALA